MTSDDPVTGGPSVVVHQRAGCGFCVRLLREADAAGLVYETVDIWADEAAAAWVRSVAGGHETVPTVRVGDVALVNPRPRELLAAVLAHAPAALPPGFALPGPSRLEQLAALARRERL